jgi:hypothetical protein
MVGVVVPEFVVVELVEVVPGGVNVIAALVPG